MRKIQELTVADVLSAYSGRAGKCCCGCAGNHYYRSDARAAAGAARGYAVGDDEVDDAMVTKVLRTIQANEESVEHDSDDVVSVEVGRRLFIAYLAPVAAPAGA